MKPMLLAALLFAAPLAPLPWTSTWVAQAPTFSLENNQLQLPSPIVFETGSAALRPESSAGLDHIAAYLTAKEYISLLRIEGHVASGGDEAQNQALSEQRARAVTAALVSRGVDCKRLIAVGFGSSKPVADNASPEGRARNNRIAAVNAQLRGKNIGGMAPDGGGRLAGDPCSP